MIRGKAAELYDTETSIQILNYLTENTWNQVNTDDI